MSTLGSLLVKNKVVGVVDIEKALQRQVIYGGDLATNLLELSIAKEEQIAKYVGHVVFMHIEYRQFLYERPYVVLHRMSPMFGNWREGKSIRVLRRIIATLYHSAF